MAANTVSSEVDEAYLKKLGIHAQIETFIQENDSLPDDFGSISTPRITRSATKLAQKHKNEHLNQKNFGEMGLNWLRSEIKYLESEINIVEGEIEAEKRRLDELRSIKKSEPQKETKPKISPQTIEHLLDLVKLSINITELKILKITNEDIKTSTDNNSVLRVHEVDGIIKNIQFQLKIFIVEYLKEELVKQSYIRKLQITIDEDRKSELQEFLYRIEHEKDIILFFRGLLEYGKILEERQILLRTLSKKYGDIVYLPKGYMGNALQCSVKGVDKSVTYEFYWITKLLPEGKLIPTIDLRVLDAKRAQKLDKDHVLQNISSYFALMVKEFDVDGALEMFLDTTVP